MEKLLVLGATCRAVTEIINEAKSRGFYTIITDNNPVDRAPVKLLADEYWMISTTATDELEIKCREEGITAVTHGISAFNIELVMKLCSRLGLSHYATPESWKYTIDKRAFKDLCKRNDVPVAKDYYVSTSPTREELEIIEFPVVVKANNLSGNRGMSYCNSIEEVVKGCEYARKLSKCDEVIVEKRLRGREYAAWYVLADGEIQLLGLYAMISPSGYPENYYSISTTCTDRKEQYLAEVNPFLINALKDAGCREGVCWVELMADDDDHLYALEMGYRLSGDMLATPFKNVYEFDAYEWLLDIAAGIQHKAKDLPENAYSKENGYAVSYILWSSEGGIITDISGYERITIIPGLNVDSRLKVGDSVIKGQYLSVITFTAKSCEEECEIIKIINENITIKNEKKDIVVRFIDFDVLKNMQCS